MKTYQPRQKDIKRSWHLIDAKDEILGRLASRISKLLTGKHKRDYSSHMDSGDYVVVVNAKDVQLTGKKARQKVYRSHSGFPGGFKEVSFKKMMSDDPRKVLEIAVSGMLPDNRLKKNRLRRFKVYKDESHPYKDKFQKKGKKKDNRKD
jgi:large subunit ribosomal protein L13